MTPYSRRQGHVVDVPYAFDSDSRDTLIVLRRGNRRPILNRDANYENRFPTMGWRCTSPTASSARRGAGALLHRSRGCVAVRRQVSGAAANRVRR